MSATERLRELLDERGVEWKEHRHIMSGSMSAQVETLWGQPHDKNGKPLPHVYHNRATEMGNGRLFLEVQLATPEQAVEVTLGRPKVKKVRNMTYDHAGGEVYFLACSGCGEWIDGDLDCIGEFDGPNFCSNCGGEFDGPMLCRKCGRLADLEYGGMCAECYEGDAE